MKILKKYVPPVERSIQPARIVALSSSPRRLIVFAGRTQGLLAYGIPTTIMADAGESKSGDHSSREYSDIVHQADVGKSGKP